MTDLFDAAEVNRFLDTYPHPDGRVLLVAIHPDTGEITAASYDLPAQVDRAVLWISDRNERDGCNLYWTVNATREPMGKKPLAADISAMHALYVDIDPRVGEDFGDERVRILGLLDDSPPGVPGPPSLVIDSGGGFQFFWALREPVPVADPEDAKRYNQFLELAYGADSCHNIDRILRLPGTINWPNPKKRDKGRQPATARVVRYDPEVTYDIADFQQAPAVAKAEKREAQVDAAVVERVENVADDPRFADASDLCKVVIVQGTDPDAPTRFPSRSEALFFVCCELVRAGLDDQTVYAVITDPGFDISASVLDKPDPEKYARRQIERARENAVDPHLREMNDRHAVINAPNVGVLCWVPSEIDDGREVAVLQSFGDFRNRYCNRRVVGGEDANGNPRSVPLGKWWLENAHRRTYDGMRFRPDLPPDGRVEGDYLNLWRGLGVDAAPGDWSLMRRHIHEVLAGGDRDHAEYIIRWSAWAVQNPARPAEVALVFRGGKGVGKGLFGRAMRRIFGQHGMQIASSGHLTGRFNDHLRDCCLLFADEAVAPDDHRADARLKSLITEPEIVIEGKGEKIVKTPNRLHIIMASNEEHVVRATKDERRYAVFNVSAARRGDRDYFGAVMAQMEAGGYAAMLHDLRGEVLGDWHPRWSIPQTEALADQQDRTRADPWLDFLGERLGDGPGKVRAEDVWAALGFEDASRRTQEHNNRLGRAMQAMGFERRKRRFGSDPEYAYVRGDGAERLYPNGNGEVL